jgi:hypothetical protein
MVLTLSKTQKILHASTAIFSLERRQDVTTILRRHHPKPAFTLDFDHIRSADQMTIAKTAILVFSVVTKHHAYASSGSDRYTAEIRGDRHIEALCLGFDDSREIKVCVAFSVEIDVYRIQHICAPVAVSMELSGIAHAPRRAGIGGLLVKFRLIESCLR